MGILVWKKEELTTRMVCLVRLTGGEWPLTPPGLGAFWQKRPQNRLFTVQFTPFSSTTTTGDGDGTYECGLASCMHMDSPCMREKEVLYFQALHLRQDNRAKGEYLWGIEFISL